MTMNKPKIAFFDFAGCEGCQLTVIDALQDHLELLESVEIVQFREAMTEKGQDFQIAFVEGSYTRPSDEERLTAIRDQADLVVALGACAHIGGVNAVRNRQNLEDVRHYVYGAGAKMYQTGIARPISECITVDAVIPGCPINPEEFVSAAKMLLQGRTPRLPMEPVCVECKLKENVCVFDLGKICLGPITRAGCGALCPSYGNGCEGCRGMIDEPNMEWMKIVMTEHGLSAAEAEDKLRLFLTFPAMEKEVAGHDNL